LEWEVHKSRECKAVRWQVIKACRCVELELPAFAVSELGGVQGSVKADSHITSRAHAVPLTFRRRNFLL